MLTMIKLYFKRRTTLLTKKNLWNVCASSKQRNKKSGQQKLKQMVLLDSEKTFRLSSEDNAKWCLRYLHFTSLNLYSEETTLLVYLQVFIYFCFCFLLLLWKIWIWNFENKEDLNIESKLFFLICYTPYRLVRDTSTTLQIRICTFTRKLSG